MTALTAGAEPFAADGGPVGVLVLHGSTGNPQSMRPLAEAFAAAGHTVSLPLLPGHGTTVDDMLPTLVPGIGSDIALEGAVESAYPLTPVEPLLSLHARCTSCGWPTSPARCCCSPARRTTWWSRCRPTWSPPPCAAPWSASASSGPRRDAGPGRRLHRVERRRLRRARHRRLSEVLRRPSA